MALKLKFNNRTQLIILFASFFIFFSIISFIPDATAGGGDDISHYNIARNAFRYPWLFLDLWGKPVFTFLSSPFAQFGLRGMQLFNIFLGLLSTYLLILIARELNYLNAWLVLPFTCFAPLYLVMMTTGMTEILFGFFLVLSAFLFFKGRYIPSSVLISFLPFVRNEGIIILPIYFLAFLIYRKWQAIPFLLSGIIVLTLAGYFYYGDLLWIFHKWPYGDTSGIYGRGDFFLYIKKSTWILGIPLIILFLSGLFSNFLKFFKHPVFKPSPKSAEFLLILGPILVYVLGHSYAWWKGTVGSGGTTRFMAAIIPLTALYSLQGFNFFLQFTGRRWYLRWIIIIIVFYFLIILPFKLYSIPHRLTVEQKLAQEASEWLRQNALGRGTIYYEDPHIQYFLRVNYFDNSLVRQHLPDPGNPCKNIPEGSYIAWDAHYMANEGRVSRDCLLSSDSLKLIKVYKPRESIKTLGGYEYEIMIFIKEQEKL